jgi:hypothetical protein
MFLGKSLAIDIKQKSLSTDKQRAAVSQVEKLDSAFSAFLNQISSCTLI